jgi:pimeloyl-ACP methyl ester carboxylesterase
MEIPVNRQGTMIAAYRGNTASVVEHLCSLFPVDTRRLVMPAFARLVIVIILLLLAPASRAGSVSDTAKEQRWAAQITDQLIVGEPEWLAADGYRFLAIYTPAETEKPKGTVLLVHGIGAHPDWPQVIQPLRIGLSEKGWRSLSIQMPLPPAGINAAGWAALLREGGDRLQAALAWLEGKGMTPVTLIAHSRGGADVLHYVATHPGIAVNSLVLIGTNADYEDVPDEVEPLQSLKGIKLPILELYGEYDQEGVIKTAPERREASAGNPGYQQVMVAGADHFFDGEEKSLLAEVTRWLESHP